MTPNVSERGLVLAPLGRDAMVAASMLAEAGIESDICPTLVELVAGLKRGAGFAIVTEEALTRADLNPLAAWIRGQAEWSDFPFILLTRRGGIERNPAAIRLLQTLGNVTFLERPFHPTTIVSLAQSALRGRRRQYDARARLKALADLNETLEARVTAAVAEQKVLADIVESTDALVQVLDADFRILAINRASVAEFERRYGRRPRVGDSILELLEGQPAEQVALKALWSRALDGEQFTEVARVSGAGGERRFHEMKFSTLFDAAERRIGAYQFVYDVTRRIEDEERLASIEGVLRQAQKMEAVGQLTGGVAHDFNNLLMSFSNGLFLLSMPLDGERRQRVLDGMRQAIERGTALTRQLLAFSRRRPLSPKTVNLGAQILAMQEMLQRSLRADIEVEMSFEEGLWPVDLDIGELELAILNMCLNARDAMPDAGRIRLAARNTRDDEPPAPRDTVTLTVEDSGAGIPADVVGRVFEPFFTTKDVGKGSGLGLAQVYGFVNQSGGRVSIDSEPGRGTRLTLTFPRSRHAVTRADAAAKAVDDAPGRRAAGRGASARAAVLLVEDDANVADLTVETLTSAGYAVAHVKSAAAALEALAGPRQVDIVFSDVMMPGGMSGVDLAREIRRRRPGLPIVLTTGYIEVARSAMAEGLEVLMKPYQLQALTRVFDAQLSEPAARAP